MEYDEDIGEEKVKKVKFDIYDIIIKSLSMATGQITHLIKSCQPDDVDNSVCYQILGFDILIDHKLKPFLLEINQTPSFRTDSKFDRILKNNLLFNTFMILCLNHERREAYKAERKQKLYDRQVRPHPDVIAARIEEMKENELKKGKKPMTQFKNPGDEEKENRRLLKKWDNMKKANEKKRRALIREKIERQALKKEDNKMNMLLIYPLLSYKDDFFIQDHFDEEEKKFKKEIEAEKAR